MSSEGTGRNVEKEAGQGSTEEGGGWEVYQKPRNRARSSAAKQLAFETSNLRGGRHQYVFQEKDVHNNGWSSQVSEFRRPVDRGNGRPQPGAKAVIGPTLGQESSRKSRAASSRPKDQRGAKAAIGPPLPHGWKWKNKASSQPKDAENKEVNIETTRDIVPEDETEKGRNIEEADEDDYDALDESDEEFFSDNYDSDASQKSHETRKKNKWFKRFFGTLDKLSVEEINDSSRQWHCPACRGGAGAADWYRGLQPLMAHAKTKGSKRVKLHRELAEVLDEELGRRGTSVNPPGQMFGQWRGLRDGEKDHDIVWPPMVVIMNTRHDKDENEKWIGMGNQELLDYFSSFAAVRARHSYGPQGHRGMSLLIFESSARGYVEAERLHKHFAEQGTDRDSWEKQRQLFYPGGKRQLYGFLATQDDLDIFNKHCKGKCRLKYDMRSYQEKVVNQIRQMSEENQQLTWLKNKVVKEKMHSKALEQSFNLVAEKLRQTAEDNRIVRERCKQQHEQNMEEMAFQEEFFKEQIKRIHELREANENKFGTEQQEKRDKIKLLNAEDNQRRAVDVERLMQLQAEEMNEFMAEREQMVRSYEEEFAAMKTRHWEEEVEFEREFDARLNLLMGKYSNSRAEESADSVDL